MNMGGQNLVSKFRVGAIHGAVEKNDRATESMIKAASHSTSLVVNDEQTVDEIPV